MLLVMIPIVKQGITLNDEVLQYQYRQQGFFPLFVRNVCEELRMGRPLRILASINWSLSFIFENVYLSRCIQCVIIFAGFASFGYFIYTLFKNIRFSFFVAIFAVLFYPVTFELSAPNAFNGLVVIPMIELFLSLGLFCTFLEKKKKSLLYSSAILLIAALLGYEFMVTFVPLYGLVFIYKCCICEHFDIKNALRAIGVCAAFCGLFIMLIYATSKLCHGEYDGTKLGFVSLESSLKIIWTLFLSALPGYWLTNAKYQYLFSIYQHGNVITLRIVLLAVVAFAILVYVTKKVRCNKNDDFSKQTWINIAILFTSGVYCFIPASANSVSQIFQGNVTSEQNTALPVTSFLYLFACFTICFIIWLALSHTKSRLITVLCMGLIILCAIPVQCMNTVFAQEQHKDSERFFSMNALFETTTMHNLTFCTVYAPELYETHNALAIHHGYFENIAGLNGIEKIQFVTEAEEDCNVMLFETGLNQWTITTGDEAVILSEDRLTGEVAVRLDSDTFVIAEVSDQGRDGDFYYYHFKKDAAGDLQVSNESPFISVIKTAGTTLETAYIQYGIQQDGWVEPEAKLQITAGVEGSIHLKGYYNQEITGKEVISVYQGENLLAEHVISGQDIEFDIPCAPNTTIELTIKSNFSFQADPPDVRELSFILSSLEGK